MLRYRRRDAAVTLVAFDLIELDGRNPRREPVEHRQAELARLLDGCWPELVLNNRVRGAGPDCVQVRMRARLRMHGQQAAWVALSGRRPDGQLA